MKKIFIFWSQSLHEGQSNLLTVRPEVQICLRQIRKYIFFINKGPSEAADFFFFWFQTCGNISGHEVCAIIVNDRITDTTQPRLLTRWRLSLQVEVSPLMTSEWLRWEAALPTQGSAALRRQRPLLQLIASDGSLGFPASLDFSHRYKKKKKNDQERFQVTVIVYSF